HKRTGVAYERLGRLMVDAPVEAVITPRELDLEHEQTPYQPVVTPTESFQRLSVEDLTYRHTGAVEGVEGVSFTVRRGEFVVITRCVGAVKTTLLRVLLRLLQRDAGVIT